MSVRGIEEESRLGRRVLSGMKKVKQMRVP